MSFLASVGPRILIPGFFTGQRISTLSDPVDIAQTIAFSALFICFALTLFVDPFLSIIPGVAAWSYWNMQKDKVNQEFYRYTDWAITTPLMLVALLVANARPAIEIASLVLLDIFMIYTGYEGVKDHDQVRQKKWFLAGCLALIPIVYMLLRLKNNTSAVLLTVALWTLYPVVWSLDEVNTISKKAANVTYSVLDVAAKVGLVTLLRL
jgi:bacteriorhodopsin